jgi:D-serine deaminase-like pyridoxal phosphate-dependent protein
MRDYAYYQQRLTGLPLPHAVLDVALLQHNIRLNLQRAGDKTIRIASKSLRCPAVMRLILEASPRFQGVMTYHGQETLYLARQGFNDLLLGYPVVSSPLLDALAEAVKGGKQICLMADSSEHLRRIDEAGRRLKTPLPVCIDLDLSDRYPGLHFGVWRSGITGLPQLEALLKVVKQCSYVRLEGLMGYEAQIAGVADNTPGSRLKNGLIRLLKRRSLRSLSQRRANAAALIQAQGFHLRFVNGGGTGSLESTTLEAAVTEVTVGSGFYAPALFDQYQHFCLQPALFYGIEVVRRPAPDIYTCQGGGFVASGATDPAKAPIVHLPATGFLDPLEGAGEVQTPIRFTHLRAPLNIGDPVFLRHAKAGELCEHFNTLHLLENDQIRAVNTYRGDGQSFG